MALTNDKTITGVLTGAASYAPTIAGQTQRIADAHEIILTKAIDMALQIQAGQGDSNINGKSALTLADNHKIMDTASAINSINVLNYLIKNSSGNYLTGKVSTSSSATYTIPVGYNKIEFTVNFTRPTLSGTAVAEDVLEGMTFYNKSYTKVTGTMLNKSGDQNSGGTSTSNGKLALKIPATGKYVKDGLLISDISANTASSLSQVNGGLTTSDTNSTATITISRYKNADGTTGNKANALIVPSGYYANSITITPNFVDAKGNTEDILNYADLQISGNLTFTNGKKVFYPLANSNVDYYANVEVPLYVAATASQGADGRFTVTTAGWINTGTYGKAYGGLTDTSLVWKTSATENIAYTDKILNSKNSWIDITKGKISDTYLKVIVRDAKASLSASLSNSRTVTPEIKVVTGGNVTNTTASTTKPTSGYYMAVLTSAKTTTITATSSCTLTTSGWLETAPSNVTATASVGANTSSITYVPVTTGILTVGNPTKNPASGTTGNISSVTAGNYYVAVTTATAGWIPSGTVYKDLGFGQGSHSIGDLRKNGNTAITSGSTTLVAANAYYIKCSTTKGYQEASDQYITIATGTPTKSGVDYEASAFTGSVTLSAGYYPNQTISLTDFKVTARDSLSVTRSGTIITAKTYFHKRTAVSVAAVEGILRDSTVKTEESNSNISINDGTETTVTATKLDALTEDTTFYATGNGTFKRYFTSFKVEVADVITALQKI